MKTADEIKKELEMLVNDSDAAHKRIVGKIADIAFINAYQNWYTRAVKLVSLLGKDRLEEFTRYYLPRSGRRSLHPVNYVIQDYISGIDTYQGSTIISSKFAAQIGIVKSLSSRIDSVLSDVEGHLFVELQDNELKVASKLVEINLRAAGAVTGVVLERHLQRTAINHTIIIEKKEPTIADLNDHLKREGVYDIPTWRQIQVLGDIRNLCVHKKESEPTEDEVKKLIKETDIIIKTIF